jgi:hypothetical protein
LFIVKRRFKKQNKFIDAIITNKTNILQTEVNFIHSGTNFHV